MKTSGYSGTPLVKKLGIKIGHVVYFENIPEHYFKLLPDLPEVQVLESPGMETVDFIHLFCTQKSAFEKRALALKPLLKKNGMLWVSWPKGSSKIPNDLSENPIREYLLANGLVDVKVCAIDQDWSGLKFVYRLKDRG
ncbi:DUF3052 domain-containing protein [Flavobacteriaceae bacterium 3-367]|uniref:DUF3052 domain-containing protein n=1 Tax=Eudoraea algarum TaxID=3417568 RepID=UPI0032824DF6